MSFAHSCMANNIVDVQTPEHMQNEVLNDLELRYAHAENFILLNNSDGCFRITLSNIVYCKSYNSSTIFHLVNKKNIVIAKPIIYYEKLLARFGFIRIHHCSLLNVSYMCHIKKGDDVNELTLTTGERLIVSRPKRAVVINALKRMSVEQING